MISRFSSLPFATALLSLLVLPSPSGGFTYVTVAGRNPVDTVVHPPGFSGKGGPLKVTLGLHPDIEDLEPDLRFSAVLTASIWNHLLNSPGNLTPSIEIPSSGGTDVLGTLIHEFGHTLGLAHPTQLPRGNIGRGKGKFTMAKPGPNGRLDLGVGPDGIRGSADDDRGDDENIVFFKKADNNPFTLPENGVIDSTTYSRDPKDLPGEDRSPNVGSREVAAKKFQLEDTEVMMVSGGSLIPGQTRRGLIADDIAGIRYAMSGLDEIQGTDDDYTLEIEYVGVNAEADIVVNFDLPRGFAAANIATRNLSGNHFALVPGRKIGYNRKLQAGRKWFAPYPDPVDREVDILNDRAVNLRLKTELGKRYAIYWPDTASETDGERGEARVQFGGKDAYPIDRTLFFFVATSSHSEVFVTFPEKRPDDAAIKTYEIKAKELNLD